MPLPRNGSKVVVGAGLIALSVGVGALGLRARTAHRLHPHTDVPLTLPGQEGNATLLFNGWRISPAGSRLPMGDMLVGGAFSPDGKTLAIANTGFARHALHLINVETESEIAAVPLAHAGNGVVWSLDGAKVYVSGGISLAGRDISVVAQSEGKWKEAATFTLGGDKKRTSVSGMALSADGQTLYALNLADNRLYVLNTADGNVVASVEVGDHPLTCRLSPDGKTLYVTCWGGKEVVVLDVQERTKPSVAHHMATGDHPNDLILASDGRLFMSCGNADDVEVHDPQTGKLLETIRTRLTPTSLPGSTPNALALTPDNKTLYVANADSNAVAVVDVSIAGKSRTQGFIPTDWYPTAVLVAPNGKLLIGSGKGTGTQPNPPTEKPANPVAPSDYRAQYIGSQLNGSLAFVAEPTPAQLTAYTGQVLANTPGLIKPASTVALPRVLRAHSPIKHILYIIKENRTYDQVFGDLPKGNGDPNLTLFGRDVTPNHHALAEQFVLLDNTYCNGEVSADGHQWCDGALASDFTQRSWVQSYSGKGQWPDNEDLTTPAGGYIWDACQRKGLTYRTYGESFEAASSEAAPVPKEYAVKGLMGHGSQRYVGIGWTEKREMRDTDKADIFLDEFRAYERAGNIPNFMVMSLGEDHTSGTRAGEYTPKASVASNDQALGKIVEGISHSRAWKETAIFVIEDDAQDGPDHVDAHRTMALVISPYTRRSIVDSTMYSTASLLRTMEMMLSLSPLTQYDAGATPMAACFQDKIDLMPFVLVPPRIALDTKNKAGDFAADVSARLDFTHYDRADPAQLNWILWHSIKGAHTPLPAPVHTALVMNRHLLATPSSEADD